MHGHIGWKDIAEHFIAMWGLAEGDIARQSCLFGFLSFYWKQRGNGVKSSETKILQRVCGVLRRLEGFSSPVILVYVQSTVRLEMGFQYLQQYKKETLQCLQRHPLHITAAPRPRKHASMATHPLAKKRIQ